MEQLSPPVERAAARRALAYLARALRLESHNLAAHPELAWQQLTNRLQWAPVPAAVIDAAAAQQLRSGQPAAFRVRTRPRESEALLRRLDHGSDWLVACAFIPRSDLLVSACADRTLRLWDVATGRPVRVLAGMPAAPLSCTATRDGRYVIATTGNPAGTVPRMGSPHGQTRCPGGRAQAVLHSLRGLPGRERHADVRYRWPDTAVDAA